MGKKDDLIAKAKELGVDLDSTETIADLEAKIAAHETAEEGDEKPEEQAEDNVTASAAEAETPAEASVDQVTVAFGSSAWALAMLASGKRVMREAWLDNHHLDPSHIRAGIRLSFEDVVASDWKAV